MTRWRPSWRSARKVVPAVWRSSWRRGRPFWGGLLMILAGLELLAIPLTSLLARGGIKLVIYIGIGGVFGFLIGALLITAAIALWVNPAHRSFYGVAGVILGIASFPASNLGGFFLGMLLAVIGGSMAFAWTPTQPAASFAAPSTTRTPGIAPGEPGDPGEPGPAGRMLAIALMPVALATGMLGAAPAASPSPSPSCILGLICSSGPSSAPSPSASGTPSPAPSGPATATPDPTPGPAGGGSPTSSGKPAPGPGASGAGIPSALPTGKASAKARKATMRKASAGSGLVAPTAISVITADSATMDHFIYQGIVQMPSAGGGTVTMMKFTASSLTLAGHAADAITESGVTAVTSSSTMSFDSNVVLYATKLSGSLAGVPVTFTPTTISDLLLKFTNLLTGLVPVTMTNVSTEQAMGTADSLTYGGGFSVSFR